MSAGIMDTVIKSERKRQFKPQNLRSKRKFEMEFKYLMGKIFYSPKKKVVIYAKTAAREKAMCYAELEYANSLSRSLLFVMSDDDIIYYTDEFRENRWVAFSEAIVYNPETDEEEPLMDYFQEEEEIRNLIVESLSDTALN